MTLLDFTIEFDIEGITIGDELKDQVEDRLRALADERDDITGAAVGLTKPSQGNEYVYQARIVAYMRPEDVAAVKQSDTVEGALKAAHSALERQVRDQRAKLGDSWKRPESTGPDE